jgi:hypothetical protein
MFADVSEERAASTFKAEELAKQQQEPGFSYSLLLTVYFLSLLFDPEDGGSTFFRKVGKLPDYTASHPSRYYSS